jgi:transcriptional regulator with XRE-family HTH domain
MSTPSKLWRQLASSKEFREEFAALQLKRGVPFQIRALLKERGWKQETLAEKARLTQGVISRVQNPDYGNLTINTIARVAAGFDVAFIGSFVPFSELEHWFEDLSEESGKIRTFELEDKEFRRQKLPIVRHRRARKSRVPRVRRSVYTNTPEKVVPQRSCAGAFQLSLPFTIQTGGSSDSVIDFVKPAAQMRQERAVSKLAQNTQYASTQMGGNYA